MKYFDPFENRGSGKFPEGTPQEMKQLSLEPGPDLFGASGFMGQVPGILKEENGGSIESELTQDVQSRFLMVAEEPEEPSIDVSPQPPSSDLISFAPEVGEEPEDREVIMPEAKGEIPIPIPSISELSHVVINAIADEGASLDLSEGVGVLNFLNEKLGGDPINLIDWTLAYCRQIAIEITGLYAPSITDAQSIWNIAYAINDFRGSVEVAIGYMEQQAADQASAEQETIDTGAGVVFDPTGFPGTSPVGTEITFDPGYTPPLIVDYGSPPPPSATAEKTNWGLIALVGVAALFILKS
jgi:hypothetical protein